MRCWYKPQDGFLLLEMLTAFALLALFSLVVTRHYVQSIEQRADAALYLKMTQCARNLFEEVLARDEKPHERAYTIDGMTVALRVRHVNHSLGQLPASCTSGFLRSFLLLDVTVSGKTNRGNVRSCAFTSGMYAQQET